MVLLQDLLANWRDGRIKLYLLHRLLTFRRAHNELFAGGDYIPLGAGGRWGRQICAFARRSGRAWVIAIAPRMVGELVYRGNVPLGEAAWESGTVTLPAGAPSRWRDVISDKRIETMGDNILRLSDIFEDFPVSLLYHEELTGESQALEGNTNATAIQHSA
jgi:(1->4)-alpha-D-glucan 1-alpha-D-glucosylmutase